MSIDRENLYKDDKGNKYVDRGWVAKDRKVMENDKGNEYIEISNLERFMGFMLFVIFWIPIGIFFVGLGMKGYIEPPGPAATPWLRSFVNMFNSFPFMGYIIGGIFIICGTKLFYTKVYRGVTYIEED